MKLKTYFLGAACSCMLWSCSFLETEPFDYIDGDDLYHTPETCMAGLAGVCYNFCVYFAAEPQLMGQHPALYENVSRLVQLWL